MRLVLLLFGLMISTSAFASPKYLNCSGEKGGGGAWKLNVAISEDHQFVTYQLNDAANFFRVDALFSSTQVRWRTPPARDWTAIFIIERSTLQIAMVEQLGDSITTSKGACTLAPTAKSAI